MTKKLILTFDCERTVVQFALLEISSDKSTELIRGKIEPIGGEISKFMYSYNNKQQSEFISVEKIDTALKVIKDKIRELFGEEINNKISAIGHRVVHGGEKYFSPVKINEEVISAIAEFYNLAPLHNPYNLAGIRAAEKLWPRVVQVACFDTAFHQTIPEYLYRKPLPEKFYLENGIRRYGFHGVFHNHVVLESSRVLRKPVNKLNLISIYISRGASICAIVNGKSLDTSMGFTPLSGLMMTTRCGDIDAEVPIYLLKLGYTVADVENILMKESGLLGVAKKSSVCEVVKNYSKDKNCKLALDMFVVRVQKYIGSYYLLMDGKVDAIVFSGDVGCEYPLIRKLASEKLNFIGAVIDIKKNASLSNKEGIFSKSNSKIKLLNIPPNEFLIIARLSYNLVK